MTKVEFEKIHEDIKNRTTDYVYDILKYAPEAEHRKDIDAIQEQSGMTKRDFNKVVKSQKQKIKRDAIEESSLSVICYDPITMNG